MDGTAEEFVAHFRAGLETLRRHPVLALPPLVIQLLVFLLTLAAVGAAAAGAIFGGLAGLGGALLGALAVGLVVGILSLVALGVVVVMAREALAGREPALGDAVGHVVARLADVLIASLLVGLAVGVGLLLLVAPGILVAVLFMFTFPALLLDGLGATEAMRRSVHLVLAHARSLVWFVVGVIVVGVVVWLVSWILGFVPVLGALAAALLLAAFEAYLAVVLVRVYQALPRS